MDLDPVQRAYDGALARLLRDLEAETHARPHVEVDVTLADGLHYIFRDGAVEHRTSLAMVTDEEAATAELADRLQDDVLELLWGQAWPRCGAHTHPAKPVAVDRRALWTCPVTGEVVAPIGEIAR